MMPTTNPSYSIRTETILLTPELAQQFKDTIPNFQRLLREGHAAGIANQIRNGEYMFNHQPIAFDAYGNLIDGQHRIEAVILAGIPIKVLVAYYENVSSELARKIFATIDAVKPRQLGDRVQLVDDKHVNQAVTRVLTAYWLCAHGKSHKMISPEMIRQSYDQLGEAVEWTLQNVRATNVACVLAAIAAFRAVHPAEAGQFVRRFNTAAGHTSENAPALRLRLAIEQKKLDYRLSGAYWRVIGVLQAFMNNEDVIRMDEATYDFLGNRFDSRYYANVARSTKAGETRKARAKNKTKDLTAGQRA